MFINYLKIAIRNLFINKGFSLINIGGLAIGMACTILILLYVQFESGYDRFHNNAAQIYRIAWRGENPQTRTPHPLAQAMAQDFPEVTQAVSLSPIWGPGLTRPTLSVRYGDIRFDEPGFYSADSTFFKVFSLKLLRGDPEKALKIPGGVVITEEIAHKYFGIEEPLGKILTLERGQNFPMTVTGVMQNIPPQSHFHFDFLISYITLKPMDDGEYYEWSDFGHFNYIVLAENTDPKAVETKIVNWVNKYLNWSEEDFQGMKDGRYGFMLQPITQIHLHSNLRWELETNSDISTVYLFISAALMILIIACINFMNLSTARSANRAKEIGIRKVVGANRFTLFIQFIGESTLISALAIAIALLLVEMTLPAFNNFTHRNLSLDFFHNLPLTIGIVVMTIVVSLLAGSYPAILLSAFHPTAVLKGKLKSGMRNISFRRIMVVLQFAISIALIAGTGIVSSQIHFVLDKKLGFDKEQVLVLPVKNHQMRHQYESIRHELMQDPSIINATAVSNVPGKQFNQNPIRWEPDDRTVSVSEMRVDYHFFETLGIDIIDGRQFSENFSTDMGQTYILNETAVRQFTWDSPIDKEIIWYDDEVTRRGKVIGVAKDFNFQSLHKSIEPLIFHVLPDEYNYFLVKINPDDIHKTIEFIKEKWNQFDPGHAFEFSFLNDDFENLYRAEEQMQSIFQYFTIFAIFVACLGLYGLITFATRQRFKEIGIRKVLGASAHRIVMLLSKEFIRWVLYANMIAWPIAYFVMSKWLQNFAYRVSIHPLIFICAGILAFIIALLTVSFQAIRAAMANPVESLHYE